MSSGRKCTFLPGWMALTMSFKKSLKFDFIPCRKGLRGRGTQRIHIQEREIKRDSGETRSSVYLHLTDVG